MENYKEVITKTITNNLMLFDDMKEYLDWYASTKQDKEFARSGYNYWICKVIEGKKYYTHPYEYEVYLSEKAYKELLEYCNKTYSLKEFDLVRTQKNSNTCWSGSYKTVDEVIDHMRNDKRSWLSNIYKEIEDEINVLKDKIKELEKQEALLKDDNYLKSKITEEYCLRYKMKEEKE